MTQQPAEGTGLSDQCVTYRHYSLLQSCEAFPEIIPQAIFDGRFDHRKPYPGGGGIRWEPLPDANEVEADASDDHT